MLSVMGPRALQELAVRSTVRGLSHAHALKAGPSHPVLIFSELSHLKEIFPANFPARPEQKSSKSWPKCSQNMVRGIQLRLLVSYHGNGNIQQCFRVQPNAGSGGETRTLLSYPCVCLYLQRQCHSWPNLSWSLLTEKHCAAPHSPKPAKGTWRLPSLIRGCLLFLKSACSQVAALVWSLILCSSVTLNQE